MSLTLHRVAKLKYAQSEILEEHAYGAARYGARWNSPDDALRFNRRIIYAADTLAQAMLEIIVHTESAVLHQVPHAHVRLGITEKSIVDLDISQLPDTWNAHPETTATQVIGDQWFDEKISPVLRVPSVILPLTVYGPAHSNYLINTLHPEIAEAVTLIGVEPLPFDPRL